MVMYTFRDEHLAEYSKAVEISFGRLSAWLQHANAASRGDPKEVPAALEHHLNGPLEVGGFARICK